MTAKSNPAPRGQEKAVETIISKSKDAEAEQDVVSGAEPAQRLTADSVAATLAADSSLSATAHGNRVILTNRGPNDLVQQFQVTVETIISEF